MTNGTYNFVSVIVKVGFVRALNAANAGVASRIPTCNVKIQLSYHVKIRFISKLTSCISSLFQKLLKILVAQQFHHLFYHYHLYHYQVFLL